jgi:hypothetical protein
MPIENIGKGTSEKREVTALCGIAALQVLLKIAAA